MTRVLFSWPEPDLNLSRFLAIFGPGSKLPPLGKLNNGRWSFLRKTVVLPVPSVSSSCRLHLHSCLVNLLFLGFMTISLNCYIIFAFSTVTCLIVLEQSGQTDRPTQYNRSVLGWFIQHGGLGRPEPNGLTWIATSRCTLQISKYLNF